MQPQIVNMLDAKTSLSRLVQTLESGEVAEFVIARNGHPAARLLPLLPTTPDRSRRIGIAKGRFDVPGDESPTSADVVALFEGT